MKKWKRSLLFWTLTILFFLTAPVIVLNARGYRFDMSRGVFVYSGTITFKSNPQYVDVKLNDTVTHSKKLNRINNSYNIPGLIPRNYEIQISAEGFQPWSKKTDVHSGIANEFWNVLLVRNNYERTDNKTPGIGKFFTYSNGKFIAYTENSGQDFSVKILDAQNREIENSFQISGWNFIEKPKKENIEWSPQGDFISIPAQRKKEAENKLKAGAENSQEVPVEYGYFIADLESETILNLNEFLDRKEISDVRWDPEEKEHVFFLSQNKLYRADIKNSGNIAEIASNVSSFDLSGKFVYYAALNNNLIFRKALSSQAEPVQITSNFPESQNIPIEKVVVYDELRIALISENGDLYIFNKGEHDDYFKKLESSVHEAHFSDDGKKLLFWGNFEISVYFLRDENSQPLRKEDEKQNITRYSEPLANVQWFTDYEHVIFTTGRWTKIIELDPRDKRNCMDLVSTEIENPIVVYNRGLEKLFFTDKKEDSTTLYSIVFPEETSLLGAVGFGG